MGARKYARRKRGSAIAEFGPAMFFLIILIFFPMLDLLGILAAYCVGWYCNFMCCRELAVRRSSATEVQNVKDEIAASLKDSGLVTFLGIDPANAADLSHDAQYPAPASGQQPVVICTTQVAARPFITIPWFSPIPGLNERVTFTIVSSRPREVTQN
ncbi:MAG: hypothetical protein K2X27_02865 [Candidatus Obscuribacterales bacterium]|nr:hypothetical protein [Candidatus Obscuribacterales bacterium]